jgi:hypothetical protein
VCFADFDHQANFSQYKTYSWQEIKPPNSLWDARIKNAVDSQLAATCFPFELNHNWSLPSPYGECGNVLA